MGVEPGVGEGAPLRFEDTEGGVDVLSGPDRGGRWSARHDSLGGRGGRGAGPRRPGRRPRSPTHDRARHHHPTHERAAHDQPDHRRARTHPRRGPVNAPVGAGTPRLRRGHRAHPGDRLGGHVVVLLFGGTAAYLAPFGYTRWAMFRPVSRTRLTAAAAVLVLAPLGHLVSGMAALALVGGGRGRPQRLRVRRGRARRRVAQADGPPPTGPGGALSGSEPRTWRRCMRSPGGR